MHLVLPFAFARSPGARQALASLPLPHLSALLRRLQRVAVDEGDELSLTPPHERVLAQALGWPPGPDDDGLLPLAAHAAQQAGLPGSNDGAQGWAFVAPTHWHLGTEQMSLADPHSLALEEADELALLTALHPLFDAADGWQLHRLAPSRWLAAHPLLAHLPTASLDRVIGRNVDPWLAAPTHHRTALRQLHRLQAEAQMVLHTHPVNDARSARGQLPINSLWFSGSGAPRPPASLPPDVTWDERLRAPALAEDWPAWAQAWQALDAGPLRELLAPAATASLRLSLCGDRHAHHYALPVARPWWQRGWLAPAGPTPLAALEGL